jgi:hypothetical protein
MRSDGVMPYVLDRSRIVPLSSLLERGPGGEVSKGRTVRSLGGPGGGPYTVTSVPSNLVNVKPSNFSL